MTPTQLTKQIRDGEFFWVTDPDRPGLELQVQKARSQCFKNTDPEARIDAATGRPLKRSGYVKVLTSRGWIRAATVRRAGSREQIDLFWEGVLTWAIN